ncbi:MAG: hypothetical protein S4CHLAM2_08870 [Chlamydiales bacterium]|nr:hypothetical protein [Chlamydiales bacterium]
MEIKGPFPSFNYAVDPQQAVEKTKQGIESLHDDHAYDLDLEIKEEIPVKQQPKKTASCQGSCNSCLTCTNCCATQFSCNC